MNKSRCFRHRALPLAIGMTLSASVIAEENGWAIEEVIVTAQKREQSLQDVPISVSAFSGEMMKNAQMQDAKQIAVMTPGMSGDSNDSFMDSINIRGISTNGFGIGAEPSVGTYQNGIYLGRTGGAVTSLYDMNRVEVVKGPQGTLFGRNASAGAISMHTQAPEQDFGGSVELGLGEDGYQEFVGVLNVPLTDQLASRFAVYNRQQDDWIKNLEDGGHIGGEDVFAGRASFSYEGDSFSGTLVLEYEDRLVAPSYYRAYDDGSGISAGLGRLGLNTIIGDRDQIRSDIPSDQLRDEGEVWGASLNLEFELSDHYSLTSITGLRGHNYTYVEDFDGTGAHLFSYFQEQEQSYFSQEFRLNYDSEGAVTWFLGVSTYREEIEARFDQTYDEDAMCESIFAAYAGDAGAPEAADEVSDCNSYYEYIGYSDYGPGIGVRNDSVDAEGDYEGWGIYGDATWAATDKLDVTVGARYTEDSRDFKTRFGGADRNYFWYSFPFYSSDFVEGDRTWDNLSMRLALNYEVDENMSAFVNLSSGYKAGGFNTFDLTLPEGLTAADVDGADASEFGATLSEFDEEEVVSFEVGLKSMWWDDRLQFDASYYRYQFDGMQAVYAIGSQIRLANAGDAVGEGVEVSMRVLPTENLDIYWGVAWSDTALEEPNDVFCESVGCRKDAQLPGSVDFSSALIATYNLPLANGDAYITLENFYLSGSPGFGDFSGSGTYETESFNETNLRIGYQSDENWSASLWVNNLTDEFNYGTPVAAEANLPAHQIGMTEPRRIGINLGYQF
jgi:iron complex outermembrane receptor protein